MQNYGRVLQGAWPALTSQLWGDGFVTGSLLISPLAPPSLESPRLWSGGGPSRGGLSSCKPTQEYTSPVFICGLEGNSEACVCLVCFTLVCSAWQDGASLASGPAHTQPPCPYCPLHVREQSFLRRHPDPNSKPFSCEVQRRWDFRWSLIPSRVGVQVEKWGNSSLSVLFMFSEVVTSNWP